MNVEELEAMPTRRTGRRTFLLFLLGIAVGVAGTLLLPRYMAPFLPAGLRGGERVAGLVLDTRREDGKLLLTVDTNGGAILATFNRKVAEVELLVGRGDSITLALSAYEPFVSDPAIAAVRKASDARAGQRADDPANRAALPTAADTVGVSGAAGGVGGSETADSVELSEEVDSVGLPESPENETLSGS